MKYIIYKITNNINNKIYIGKHKTDNLDDGYFGSGTYLKCAIKKYGKENFTFHLLFELQNEEEMNLLEKCVVNKEFLKRSDVYNLKEGGEGGGFYSLQSRKKMSESSKNMSQETRKKISESLKGNIPWNKGKRTGLIPWNYGKHLTEETLKKISENRKGKCCGKEHPFYGKHHSEDSRKKMSLSHIGKMVGEKHPNFGKHLSDELRNKILQTRIKFPVLQYTLDFKFVSEYESSREAERQTGIAHNNINKCCKGIYYQTNGYIWVYKDDTLYFF